VKAFRINIVGLSNKVHEFDFEVKKSFFNDFGGDLVEDADLNVKVNLDKHETFLDAEFQVTGKVMLVCDRSLEHFEESLSIQGRILFKYAAESEEISDDIVHIAHDTATLDLSQYIYDLVGTSLPMKRVHPRFVMKRKMSLKQEKLSTHPEAVKKLLRIRDGKNLKV